MEQHHRTRVQDVKNVSGFLKIQHLDLVSAVAQLSDLPLEERVELAEQNSFCSLLCYLWGNNLSLYADDTDQFVSDSSPSPWISSISPLF